MQLSENFTYEEFVKSQTAIRLGIRNVPTSDQIVTMITLCEEVLQPIRHRFGITNITSGFRCKELNRIIGGSRRSQHCEGLAADIEVPGLSNYQLAKWIEEHLAFDQLILEFHTPGVSDSGWVHVSYQNEKLNRNVVLTAIRQHHRTIYKTGLAN